MHPVHVEPIDWFSSRWLVPGIERPNLGGLKSGKHLPGGEVVSESMLLVFPNSMYKFSAGSRIWKIIYWAARGFLTGNWTNCSENIRPGKFVSKIAWPVAFLIIFSENIGASVISTVYRGSLWPSDESVILVLFLDYLLVRKSLSELQIPLHLHVQNAP